MLQALGILSPIRTKPSGIIYYPPLSGDLSSKNEIALYNAYQQRQQLSKKIKIQKVETITSIAEKQVNDAVNAVMES